MSSTKANFSEEEISQVKSWSMPDMQGDIANAPESDAARIKRLMKTNPTSVEVIEAIQQKAYEEGLKLGKQQGKIQFEEQQEILKNKFITIVNAMQKPLQRINDEVDEELLQLCLIISKQVLRRELKQAPEQIAAVIRECLSVLPSTELNPKIRLHPDDLACVREIYPSSGNEDESSWQLIEDSSITPGGCEVDTKSTHIDATIEARINQLASKILGGSRDSD